MGRELGILAGTSLNYLEKDLPLSCFIAKPHNKMERLQPRKRAYEKNKKEDRKKRARFWFDRNARL
jgi:hypothetical protein